MAAAVHAQHEGRRTVGGALQAGVQIGEQLLPYLAHEGEGEVPAGPRVQVSRSSWTGSTAAASSATAVSGGRTAANSLMRGA
ncbi:hypothetical protein SF23_10300 [Streptomyces sp. MBRL 10]|nr:hypothetical protein SF23_10300 [Streptomyces sp. MBRL 10]